MTATKTVVLRLLWCVLAMATIAVGSEGGDVAEAPANLISLPEMQAMLIEMRGELAEQKAELRLAKAQVGEEIRDLQRKNQELESKLDVAENINTDLNNTVTQLESIQASKVAFSASFITAADNHIGPFSTDTTLVFDNIFTNIGGAYDPRSGVFTAPKRGVYQFRYHIFAGGDHGAGAKLLHNGQQVVAAYNHKAPHDINTSQGVSLLLEVGDTVSLLLEAGWWVTAYTGHLTTFSGHLLFLM